MSKTISKELTEADYEKAAEDYLRGLPLVHFMEPTFQATQRTITLESFDLIHAANPDIQVFNELLVQYPREGKRRPGQVVPDNMVVLWKEPIKARGSYDVPFQPVGPHLVLGYVTKSTKRKDYKDNMVKYEKELKVPYYLLFDPDKQKLMVFQHDGEELQAVQPNRAGRLPIPSLEIEAALLDGWVRYWHRGELVPLPPDMRKELQEKDAKLKETEKALRAAQQEIERLRDQLRTPPGKKNGPS